MPYLSNSIEQMWRSVFLLHSQYLRVKIGGAGWSISEGNAENHPDGGKTVNIWEEIVNAWSW